MLSIIINILFSILLIFLLHKAFEFIKHRLTNEETQNIGIYQSKKYDALVEELQNIKRDNVNVTQDIADETANMESELSNFMNEL